MKHEWVGKPLRAGGLDALEASERLQNELQNYSIKKKRIRNSYLPIPILQWQRITLGDLTPENFQRSETKHSPMTESTAWTGTICH